MGIESYSTTAASNNSAPPNGWPEGQAPSTVNDCARQMMASLRTWYETAEWINYGYTHTYASGTSFTIASSDQTAKYTVGRRIKAVGSSTGTIYGIITASAFSTNTTVTVSWDSGSLSNETLTIYIGILNPSTLSIPPLVDTYPIVVGSSDRTKRVRLEVDGLTTGTTRVVTVPDADLTMVGTATTQTLTNKTVTDNLAGNWTSSGRSAFEAKVGTQIDNVTGNGAAYNIILNTEILDRLSEYNNTTGVFTATVTGQYLLSGIVQFIAIGSSTRITIDLVTSNRTYGIYDGNDRSSGNNLSKNWSMLVDMDAADTAFIQVGVTGVGANTSDIGTGTYFCGVLYG